MRGIVASPAADYVAKPAEASPGEERTSSFVALRSATITDMVIGAAGKLFSRRPPYRDDLSPHSILILAEKVNR